MTGNDINIVICEHVVDRFIERFATNFLSIDDKNVRRQKAEAAMKQVFQESNYISDNDESILFHNRDLNMGILLKHKRMITVFPIRRKNGKKKHK